jgi:transcriptional antiterminator RfaH
MATHKPVEAEEIFGELEISKSDKKWYVIHTKPKQEKKLAEYSLRNKITYYLPLQDSIRVYSNRKIKFTKPLFPSYLFAQCSFYEKRTLTISGHTVNFLDVINEKELVGELKQIYSGKEIGAEFKTHKYVRSGTKVEIISGSMKGLTGIVEDQNNLGEVILQVEILRQAVSVKIAPEFVKILKGSK